MIIVMNNTATEEQIENVVSRIKKKGLEATISKGIEKTLVGAVGDERLLDPELLQALPGVEQALHIVKPYKIVAREWHKEDSVIDMSGHPIGGKHIQIISGPCSVETTDQMEKSAKAVKAAGVKLMRGGAFKPRTSPYSFQGVGFDGLDMFRKAADNEGLPIVTELLDIRHLDKFLEQKVDVIQIGTRSMQNFELLREVGKVNIPIILKRGMSATISEWLMAAEYIAAGGNHNIIFCERGIRTFETYYRNVLDVTAIPVLKKETHLPVIIDPSHSGGKAWMVAALSRAGIAAGADGLLVEMHPNPCEAWCDADQAINPDELKILMNELSAIAKILGRTISD
ncbi:MAG: 3-deoxy-7-phosphoheptulonate synthase [Methylophilaceae bacterium]|nr:3-deoxy-7-phosphoheptulonate synthase [Methylophilaceae bacterium]